MEAVPSERRNSSRSSTRTTSPESRTTSPRRTDAIGPDVGLVGDSATFWLCGSPCQATPASATPGRPAIPPTTASNMATRDTNTMEDSFFLRTRANAGRRTRAVRTLGPLCSVFSPKFFDVAWEDCSRGHLIDLGPQTRAAFHTDSRSARRDDHATGTAFIARLIDGPGERAITRGNRPHHAGEPHRLFMSLGLRDARCQTTPRPLFEEPPCREARGLSFWQSRVAAWVCVIADPEWPDRRPAASRLPS